ncbi:MAG: hypothetical protein GF334_06225 [Candidatus Altiarchaeales archaeon]|nr:hypothetical protein [Candidatus Altiarchaeales archaeon]
MASVESFGLDRDDIQPNKFQRFKMKGGQQERIGIIYADPKSIFKGTLVHYKDRYFICKSEGQKPSDKKEICCLHSYDSNTPKWRVGCIIVIYDIEKKDGKDKLKGYNLIPWIFSQTMYEKIRGLDFPVTDYDLRVKCTNEEFQNIDITPARNSLWQSNEGLKKKILSEAEGMFNDIPRNLASDLSVTEIRELLGIDAPGAEDAAEDIGDIGDIIEDS